MVSSPSVDASSHNNGNVMGITNLVDGTRSQQFTYDQLNRLLTAESTSTYATSPAHCWGEAYVYDNSPTTPGEYGNLTNINVASTAYNGCTQESLSVAANTSNQLTAFSYDASGNTLNDTHNSYAWNAESEIKTAAGVTYTYDGDGNRVQKSNGKIYWYGAGSEVLDESDASGNITDEYVYFGGKRVAHRVVSTNALYFYGEDMLGTSRTIFTSAGVLCYDADFYPFGGERAYTNTCAQNYKFTGKERDSESNLDNFGARYNASQIGRFISPDQPLIYQDKTDPQSLNLYSFVRNGPLNRVDPNGHLTIIVPGTGWSPSDWNGNMKLIQEAKEAFHDSDVRILGWSGDLGGAAIDQGAQMLETMVNTHTFAPDEQLNIIGHSRGGDVALDASGELDHKIDNLITLATPVYEGLSGDSTNIGNWLNVSTQQDIVPWLVSTAPGDDPNSATSFKGANNLSLNASGYGRISAHSAIWQDQSLRAQWWAFWKNHAACHEWFDGATNTVHGCQ